MNVDGCAQVWVPPAASCNFSFQPNSSRIFSPLLQILIHIARFDRVVITQCSRLNPILNDASGLMLHQTNHGSSQLPVQEIPKWNHSSGTDIRLCFSECASFASVVGDPLTPLYILHPCSVYHPSGGILSFMFWEVYYGRNLSLDISRVDLLTRFCFYSTHFPLSPENIYFFLLGSVGFVFAMTTPHSNQFIILD